MSLNIQIEESKMLRAQGRRKERHGHYFESSNALLDYEKIVYFYMTIQNSDNTSLV